MRPARARYRGRAAHTRKWEARRAERHRTRFMVVIAVSPPAAGQSPDPSNPGSDQSPPGRSEAGPTLDDHDSSPRRDLEREARQDWWRDPAPSDLNPDISVRPPVPHPGTTP